MKGVALAREGSVTIGLTRIEQEERRDEVLGRHVLLPGGLKSYFQEKRLATVITA